MANGIQTQVKPEVLVVAGLLAVGGIALILIGMGQGGAGESKFTDVVFRSITTDLGIALTTPTVNATLGKGVTVSLPMYIYQGPSIEIACYFELRQHQIINNAQVYPTVYGSGLSISRAQASVQPGAQFVVPIPNLIPTPCPTGTGPQDMCLLSYQDALAGLVTGICGAPPMRGPADLVFQVWAFNNSYQPPTCDRTGRLFEKTFPGKVNFI